MRTRIRYRKEGRVSEKGESGKKSSHDALTEVLKALSGLDDEGRSRVLNAVSAFFGGKSSVAAPAGEDAEGSKAVAAGDRKTSGRALSLREFMNEKQPSTAQQKIATFAYYREHYEKNPKFSPSELHSYFAAAKEGEPGNYARDFRNAVKDGWIEDKGPDSYLTATGVSAVEAGFGGKGKPRGVSVTKRKDGGKKK